KLPRDVIAWGSNNLGQLNIPDRVTNTVAISARFNHSLALQADGTVLAWGNNSAGQCDVPASATNLIAVSAGAEHSLALRSDGTVLGWGATNSSYGQANPP